MRFRKPKEAGNQGRGTVIESICWKRRMHLVAGSRLREKAHAVGTAQGARRVPLTSWTKQKAEFELTTTAEMGHLSLVWAFRSAPVVAAGQEASNLKVNTLI